MLYQIADVVQNRLVREECSNNYCLRRVVGHFSVLDIVTMEFNQRGLQHSDRGECNKISDRWQEKKNKERDLEDESSGDDSSDSSSESDYIIDIEKQDDNPFDEHTGTQPPSWTMSPAVDMDFVSDIGKSVGYVTRCLEGFEETNKMRSDETKTVVEELDAEDAKLQSTCCIRTKPHLCERGPHRDTLSLKDHPRALANDNEQTRKLSDGSTEPSGKNQVLYGLSRNKSCPELHLEHIYLR
jgi:hypothetical protein